MRPRAKICGITRLSDARAAVRAGADFLGFVFYPPSPRFISPEKARRILRHVPARIKSVGVFAGAPIADVRATARLCGLDYLQLHGGEDAAYLRRLSGYRKIKAVRVKNAASLRHAARYPADLLLFDAFRPEGFGGTGRTFDWRLLEGLGKVSKPFFVSGGLTPENVRALLDRVRPYGVDVSSGVEISPGKKSARLIKRFMKELEAGSGTPESPQASRSRGRKAQTR